MTCDNLILHIIALLVTHAIKHTSSCIDTDELLWGMILL